MPAMPAPIATTNTRTFGASRSDTSASSSGSSPGGTNASVRRVNANSVAAAIATMTPITCIRTPRLNIDSSSTTVPIAADIAGPISGAITIDPTTVAGELRSKPAVAITAEITVINTYVPSPEARSSAFACSSSREIRPPPRSDSSLYSSSSASKRREMTVSAATITVYARSSIPASRRRSRTGSTAAVGSGNVATAVYSRPLVSSVTT